jgi:hypothetical protein
MIACDGTAIKILPVRSVRHDRQRKFDRATPFALAVIELA